ncbi:MAG: CheR family methyltransferase [Candidatus Krumholzibacteriia bacterium]
MHFPAAREADLERGARAAARAHGFPNAQSYIEKMLSLAWTQEQAEILASHLTVGETCFFRETEALDVLKREVLPQLVWSRRNDRRLNFWSAGCCTGEEPYSLAILVREQLQDPGDWDVRILASDVNPRFLRIARTGIYSRWSFRGTPQELRRKYFDRRADDRFEIHGDIRDMVTFTYGNLVEHPPCRFGEEAHGMDVILCRNLLMYFSDEQRARAISNLHRALDDDGWLLVSAVESFSGFCPQFDLVHSPGAIFYRKTSRQGREQERGPRTASSDTLRPGGGAADDMRGEVVPLQDTHRTRAGSRVEVRQTHVPQESPNREPEAAPGRDPYSEAKEAYRLGRHDEVLRRLLAILPARGERVGSPGFGKEAALLARTYADVGRLEEAFHWCRDAIEAERMNADLHYLLGVILQEQERTEEAVKSLRRAVYLDPDHLLAHLSLANIRRQQDRIQEAERLREKALGLLDALPPDAAVSDIGGVTADELKALIRSPSEREVGA